MYKQRTHAWSFVGMNLKEWIVRIVIVVSENLIWVQIHADFGGTATEKTSAEEFFSSLSEQLTASLASFVRLVRDEIDQTDSLGLQNWQKFENRVFQIHKFWRMESCHFLLRKVFGLDFWDFQFLDLYETKSIFKIIFLSIYFHIGIEQKLCTLFSLNSFLKSICILINRQT